MSTTRDKFSGIYKILFSMVMVTRFRLQAFFAKKKFPWGFSGKIYFFFSWCEWLKTNTVCAIGKPLRAVWQLSSVEAGKGHENVANRVPSQPDREVAKMPPRINFPNR